MDDRPSDLATENEEGDTERHFNNDPVNAHVANIQTKRTDAKEGQNKSRNEMLRRTKQILPPLQVGEPVLLPIPEFDRGRLDCRNIPGVVVAVTDRETYRVGTKHGTVSNSYSRSELVKGDCAIVTVGEVNTDVKSLRQLASLHSDHGGQGFSKCICGSTCASKRCTCKKSGVKCNSHCHPRNTKCINK